MVSLWSQILHEDRALDRLEAAFRTEAKRRPHDVVTFVRDPVPHVLVNGFTGMIRIQSTGTGIVRNGDYWYVSIHDRTMPHQLAEYVSSLVRRLLAGGV